MEKTVYVCCPKCGEEYTISREYWLLKDQTFECTKCHSEIDVSYCGYCSVCDKKIGFRHSSLLSIAADTVAEAINGIVRPGSTILSWAKRLDNIPEAQAYGICPYCGTEYLKCPKCGRSVQFPSGGHINDIIVCPECKTRMRHP